MKPAEKRFLLIGYHVGGDSAPFIGREFRTVADAAGYAWRYEDSVGARAWQLMTRFKGNWRIAGAAQRRLFHRLYWFRGAK